MTKKVKIKITEVKVTNAARRQGCVTGTGK